MPKPGIGNQPQQWCTGILVWWATWQISIKGFPNIQQNPKWLQAPSVCPQPHVCTAFDILRDRPRGTMNCFSCRWAVATKTMIHSGFQPVLYYILRKCSSEAGSVWRNCPETTDPVIWNTYYLHRKPWQSLIFFQDETLNLVAQKKRLFLYILFW